MIFPDLDVRLALDEIDLDTIDDAWGIPGVEPYAIPFFFKIDGERHSIRISLPTLSEGLAGRPIYLVGPGAATEDGQIHDDPIQVVRLLSQQLIGNQSYDEGDSVDMSHVAYETTLRPIPVDITIGSLSLLEAAEETILTGIDESLDAVLYEIERAVEFFFDVDVHGSCPPSDDGILNELGAVFRTAVPGAVNGIFLLAENDSFAERHARDVQREIAKFVQSEIQELLTTVPLVGDLGVPYVSEYEEDAFQLRVAVFGAGSFALEAFGWVAVATYIGFVLGVPLGPVGAGAGGVIGAAIGALVFANPDDFLLSSGEPATVTLTHIDFWDPISGRLSTSTRTGSADFDDHIPGLQDDGPKNEWTLTWRATAALAESGND